MAKSGKDEADRLIQRLERSNERNRPGTRDERLLQDGATPEQIQRIKELEGKLAKQAFWEGLDSSNPIAGLVGRGVAFLGGVAASGVKKLFGGSSASPESAPTAPTDKERLDNVLADTQSMQSRLGSIGKTEPPPPMPSVPVASPAPPAPIAATSASSPSPTVSSTGTPAKPKTQFDDPDWMAKFMSQKPTQTQLDRAVAGIHKFRGTSPSPPSSGLPVSSKDPSSSPPSPLGATATGSVSTGGPSQSPSGVAPGSSAVAPALSLGDKSQEELIDKLAKLADVIQDLIDTMDDKNESGEERGGDNRERGGPGKATPLGSFLGGLLGYKT